VSESFRATNWAVVDRECSKSKANSQKKGGIMKARPADEKEVPLQRQRKVAKGIDFYDEKI
jgi:hypothetical protein